MDSRQDPGEDATTQRFQQKRERILDAATRLINRHGVKGMTFVDVAELVELNTTSVTYYFKRKELLAAAVLGRTIDRLEGLIRDAGAQATPRTRVARYVEAHLELHARIELKQARPITVLSDIRALGEPFRSELTARYVSAMRKVRDFFEPPRSDRDKILRTIRAHILVQNMFWLPGWLPLYSVSDYPRIARRMIETLEHGIAPDGANWTPRLLQVSPRAQTLETEGMPENFARAATCLINEKGYRGASVEQIASELNVTKGSFYHHLEAKDELVLECFRRSHERIWLVQRAAIEAGGSQLDQLAGSIATLLEVQLCSDFPLLRTTALQVLPSEWRNDMLERSTRLARRFAGMMIDGISDGTVRTIDPLIASQFVMGALNSAYDLRGWIAPLPQETAIGLYSSTVAHGLFADS
ncbi:TetR/AcrR family transcriptional regulator [uncultured Maricaulis sp.]|uniref:TetR/AcrR family transcriptional regulator n=1 Tax=uncultured Maricaulis sp. TaxID=174710 RepID=UPI0030D98654|tara:strand:- start:28600 stop:29838 length:1239 start_codon:yes stop_codon:yes gene_type:complete